MHKSKTWAQLRRMSRIWKCSIEGNILSSIFYVLWKHASWKIQEIRKTQSTWWFWETEASFFQQIPFASGRLWKPLTDRGHCTRDLTPLPLQDRRWVPQFLQMLIRNHWHWLTPSVCQAGWAGRHCSWSPRAVFGANSLRWEPRLKGLVYTLENSIPRAMISSKLVTVETVLKSKFPRWKW